MGYLVATGPRKKYIIFNQIEALTLSAEVLAFSECPRSEIPCLQETSTVAFCRCHDLVAAVP